MCVCFFLTRRIQRAIRTMLAVCIVLRCEERGRERETAPARVRVVFWAAFRRRKECVKVCVTVVFGQHSAARRCVHFLYSASGGTRCVLSPPPFSLFFSRPYSSFFESYDTKIDVFLAVGVAVIVNAAMAYRG